ncbi:D-alanyl-D-alanine carboxypeptidase [Patescibacteria group bacterium]|nr:D-alanyl-D-alanine carboxypeptidase [Patescibacteria group bacterium]
MVFWEFLLNLIVIGQLSVMPTAWFSTLDYQSDINRIDYLVQQGADNMPRKVLNDSLGVDITAKSAIALDRNSGAILWQKNIDNKQSIASLTKLMTVLVWQDFGPGLEEEITILESDYREGGRFYLFKGEKVLTGDLLKSVLIASDNTAAITLARSTRLSLESFIIKMNEKAMELGMIDSVFTDPTGLDSGNKSTVKDLVLLAEELFVDKNILNIAGTKDISYQIINNGRYNRVESTNSLLETYLNIIAGKTGFSDEAGGCLLTISKGDRGQEILTIILGSEDRYIRFQEGKSLIQWVQDNYIWPDININK